MSRVSTDEKGLVEVTASVKLTFPPVVTFEEALKEAILRQPWAEEYPAFAQKLYDDLISNPELINLLKRFPGEVSIEELITKVGELIVQLLNAGLAEQLKELGTFQDDPTALKNLIWEFIQAKWVEVTGSLPPDDVVLNFENDPRINNAIKEYYEGADWETVKNEIVGSAANPAFYPFGRFDLSALTTDLSVLYKLLEWRPRAAEEQAAITALKTLLDPKITPETIRIGGQVVPVPFRDQFELFLHQMEARQAALQALWDQYFGEEENNPLAEFFKWLFKQTNSVFTQENVEAVFQLYLESIKGTPLGFAIDEWEHVIEPTIGEDAANSILATLATLGYGISQIGTNFQAALMADPINALAGMALGIAGTATGGFLFLDVFFYVTEPELGWGKWRYDTGNPAFQAGMAIGEFGMGVAQTIVAAPVAAGSNPSIGLKWFNVTVPKWLPGAELAMEFQAIVPVVVVQDLSAFGVGGLGAYGAAMSAGNPGDEKGKEREQFVADLVGGEVSREPVTAQGVGSTDVDVIGPNGELILVGGPAKANDLGKVGQASKIIKIVADERGVQALAYFEQGTPQTVIDIAEKWLGKGNVFVFKRP